MQIDDSNRTSATERIAEIDEILALGLRRLLARKSSQVSDETGESLLDFVARQSGHGNSEMENVAR